MLQLEKAQILIASCWHATQTPFTPGMYGSDITPGMYCFDISWRLDTSTVSRRKEQNSEAGLSAGL